MFVLIMSILLLVLAAIASSLRPVYKSTPTKELLRQSRKGNVTAKTILAVSKYGVGADMFLALIAIIFSSLAFAVLASSLNIFLVTFIIIISIFIIFYILPVNSKKTPVKIAKKISPYIAKILKRIPKLTEKPSHIPAHTGLYEKEDLLELLQNQKATSHNRIGKPELDMAYHALTFGDKSVEEFMTPKREAHVVSGDDPIGPVLLTELHDSGFSRFPVQNEKNGDIVGTLFIKDLIDKRASGIVSNVMSSSVYYVSETAKLQQVLDAFLKTKHHIFIVVNEFEEMTGVITIEDVLEQIIGHEIVDEFDKYDDLREVAAKSAKKDSREHKRPK